MFEIDLKVDWMTLGYMVMKESKREIKRKNKIESVRVRKEIGGRWRGGVGLQGGV